MSVDMTISGVSSNVQALLENTGSFKDVLPHEPVEATQFSGYPSAAHYYSNAESQYATVSQNRRIFEYVVELYVQYPEDKDEADKYSETYALIDEIMQMFDESIDLSDAGIPLTPACDIMRPTPGELQRVNLDDGPGFVATLRLFTEADITFRSS